MNEETQHTQPVVEARSHITSLNAAICAEAVAHHNYWAWYYIEKITDTSLRAALETELTKASQQKAC